MHTLSCPQLVTVLDWNDLDELLESGSSWFSDVAFRRQIIWFLGVDVAISVLLWVFVMSSGVRLSNEQWRRLSHEGP